MLLVKRPENEGGGAVVGISIIGRICEALGTQFLHFGMVL